MIAGDFFTPVGKTILRIGIRADACDLDMMGKDPALLELMPGNCPEIKIDGPHLKAPKLLRKFGPIIDEF